MQPTGLKLFDDYTPVYYWNRDADTFYVVNQGGTSSSKTVSILKVLCRKALECSNKVFTIVGQDMPNLKVGALRDFRNLMSESPLLQHMVENWKSIIGPYRWRNGNTFEFKSYDNWQDAKSGKRDYLFINEADGIEYDIALQLILRTKDQVFIDYNPSSEFWVHHHIIPLDNASLFISNYRHNQYVPDMVVDQLLEYQRKWLETGDIYWKNKWMVYGLGKTGVVEGVVFEHVNWVKRMPQTGRFIGYGLDFGFANDPTAMCRAMLVDGEIYAEQILYDRGMTSLDLLQIFPKIGVSKNLPIFADASQSEAIAVLQRKGYNVIRGKRFQGAIQAGIDLIHSYGVNITHASRHWKDEQRLYTYKKRNGVYINEPEDAHNHLWDALRYWALGRLKYKFKDRPNYQRKLHIFNADI